MRPRPAWNNPGMLSVTSADTTTLSVRTWGSADAALVVLVHGLGMSVQSWGVVPELLAVDHHVVAHDLRGHGESGRAAGGDYTLDAHRGGWRPCGRVRSSPGGCAALDRSPTASRAAWPSPRAMLSVLPAGPVDPQLLRNVRRDEA